MIAFFVGFVSFLFAAIGLGGGFLLIPLITSFFGIDQMQAQYVSLLVYIPAAVGVIVLCIKKKNAEFRKIIPLIPIGMAGAICGGFIALNMNTILLKKIYSIFLIIVGAIMCIKILVLNQIASKKGDFNSNK